MGWEAAVERNRDGLKHVLAALVGMAELANGGSLPRQLCRTILRLLRPAEAAARRLVIVLAQQLVATMPAPRPRKSKPKPGSIFVRDGKGTGIVLPPGMRPADLQPLRAQPPRTLSIPLLDPLRLRRAGNRSGGMPRICVPGSIAPSLLPVRRALSADDPVDASRIRLRLQALGRTLDDLQGRAKRMARWLARRNACLTRRLWPLRPGRPPGSRPRPTHVVDDILIETHGMAFDALERRDTS
jgi:hypothetical protein